MSGSSEALICESIALRSPNEGWLWDFIGKARNPIEASERGFDLTLRDKERGLIVVILEVR